VPLVFFFLFNFGMFDLSKMHNSDYIKNSHFQVLPRKREMVLGKYDLKITRKLSDNKINTKNQV
jgi:hypothetical protein